MQEMERQTQSRLKQLMEAEGIRPRKMLGQNFLIDLNLLEFIAQQAHIGPDDVVLEVGTGTGGLTMLLARDAAAVVSVEVDRQMYKLAQKSLCSYENVTLLNCDALKNKNQISRLVLDTIGQKLAAGPDRGLKLVANLPYVIATPVISNLVATELPWCQMVVTIQWELAQRMQARPRTHDYSALSVWLQSQCDVKLLKKLPPSVFWPRPKVESAIIRISPDAKRRHQIVDREFFHTFIRRLFHQRRKYLRSVLVSMYSKQLSKPNVDAILQQFPFEEDARAEQLDGQTLVRLAAAFKATIDVSALYEDVGKQEKSIRKVGGARHKPLQ